MDGPLPLGPLQLGLAASLILVNGALSVWLGLGLERKLLVASARTVVQLMVMGYLLVGVFALEHPALVIAMALVMVMLAAREAVRRASRGYRGGYLSAFGALVVSAGGTAVLGSAVIIGVDPWWDPQYLIPLVGMILGNALTGISLGLDRVLVSLDEGRARVEALVAMGATWWEAGRPVASDALRTGMIPILNVMSAVGLVTIPGMMTGQILGGTPPGLAARYQILILFLIASATAMGAGLAVLLAVWGCFDDQHRLRVDRIVRR